MQPVLREGKTRATITSTLNLERPHRCCAASVAFVIAQNGSASRSPQKLAFVDKERAFQVK